jgi:hypothetical protein
LAERSSNGKKGHAQQVDLPTELVERASTAAPR